MELECEKCGGELLPILIGDSEIGYTCEDCTAEHDLNGKLVVGE